MQNTTHYNLKKPDYTDFADIQDINDNMDTIDGKLAAPDGDGRDQTVSFTDADLDTGITSFPTFLTKIVSGMKLAKFLRDFKAGMAYVLHVGNLVNNATCTESGKALDARMGKTLQDQITSLNDSLTPVEVTVEMANASVLSITNGFARALVIGPHHALVFFNFTVLASTNRAAYSAICRFNINGRYLTWYGSVPYNFVCKLDADPDLYMMGYNESAKQYISTPIQIPANSTLRFSGVSLMLFES